MSSNAETLTPGGAFGPFKLIERLGTSVWRAEDSRSGKTVAIKILASRLPAEPARRESIVRDVRLSAAIRHATLVSLDEVLTVGDALVVVMEYFDGEPLSKVANEPLTRERFFRIAWQIASSLKIVHDKGLVHGNLNGDSVLINGADEVRVGGLNLSNLVPRDGIQRTQPDDMRRVAYLSPEQITNQPAEPRSDIFSLGVVFYQLATGKLPFQAPDAAELARRIVSDNPASPKSYHATIDTAVMSVLGKCLFKDPMKRYKDARAVCEDVQRLDPEAPKFSEELARQALMRVTAKAKAASVGRDVILLVGDVANYDDLVTRDAEAASRAAARMQQILGEAAYLFDGKVVDPFGPRMIAELPSVESAIEAARKSAFDISPDQQGTERLVHIRLLLHAGRAEVSDMEIRGDAVDKALAVIENLQPLQLFITEDFAKIGRNGLRLRDAGARAGTKLFQIAEPEPEPEPSSEPIELVGEASSADTAPAPSAAAAAPVARRKSPLALIAVVAVLIGIVGGGAAMLWLRHRKDEVPVAAAPVKAVVAAKPARIYVEPFKTEGTDPQLADRATAIQLAAVELLRRTPGIQVADRPGPDVASVSATLRAGANGLELVPTASGGAAGAPVAAADSAAGIRPFLDWVAAHSSARPTLPQSPAAINAFADAVSAVNRSDDAKADASLRAAIQADPSFMTAQLMAFEYFRKQGKDADALSAAKTIAAADPANLDVARYVARESIQSGDPAAAINAYSAILKRAPSDTEALNVLAQYALSVGDEARFSAIVKKLGGSSQQAVHDPDVFLNVGRIEAAINRYYDVEVEQPSNAALALKIGRISVLRRSMPIADLELKKLQQLDPLYGYPLLRAYVAAENRNRAQVASALAEAQKAAQPTDSYWTSVAEVSALLADNRGVMDSLEKAIDKGEPTGAYIQANPLFAYLRNDARFVKVQERISAQQEAVRTALASAPR